jgi:hypothetical protein
MGAKVKLEDVSKILGLSGKPGKIDGSLVEEMVLAGQIEEVARYRCRYAISSRAVSRSNRISLRPFSLELHPNETLRESDKWIRNGRQLLSKTEQKMTCASATTTIKVMNPADKKRLSEIDICDMFISPAVKSAGWDQMTQIGAK